MMMEREIEEKVLCQKYCDYYKNLGKQPAIKVEENKGKNFKFRVILESWFLLEMALLVLEVEKLH